MLEAKVLRELATRAEGSFNKWPGVLQELVDELASTDRNSLANGRGGFRRRCGSPPLLVEGAGTAEPKANLVRELGRRRWRRQVRS